MSSGGGHIWSTLLTGGLSLKIVDGEFRVLGPQNLGKGSEEEQMARCGIEEFASS